MRFLPAHKVRMAREAKLRPEDTAEIAHRMRALRATTGLSQRKFAAEYKLGVSQWTQIEQGNRIGIDAAINLVREFGLTLDWIYLGDRSRMPRDLLAEIDAKMDDTERMAKAG